MNSTSKDEAYVNARAEDLEDQLDHGWHVLGAAKEYIAQLEQCLKIAEGALRSCVGYEPFQGSLEPHKASEALARIEAIRKGENAKTPD